MRAISQLLAKHIDKTQTDIDILISIKPKYAERIFQHKKKYEYRLSIFKKQVSRAFVYSTSPLQKIIGYFIVGHILVGSPQEIWKQTRKFSGMTARDFFLYAKKDKIFAIYIKKPQRFIDPIDPKEINSFFPPQSFYYL